VGKIKKFAELNIRRITGGKDPLVLVEEFILKLGFDPDKVRQEKNGEFARWMLEVEKGKELEVLLENIRKSSDTTIYLGLNVVQVPVRGASDMLAAALEIADGLIGIKVSLVGHFLVLSSSLAMSGTSIEDLEYNFRLIREQEAWFKSTLLTELGWEEAPAT